MLRLSRMTDYGVVIVGHLANQQGRTVTATDVASATGLTPATVSQVLKKLAHGALVVSHRGAHGGYSLARPPADITVAELIATFDGPVALTDCVDGTAGSCGVESLCPMRGAWDKVNTAIRTALESVTLADMLGPGGNVGRGGDRFASVTTLPAAADGHFDLKTISPRAKLALFDDETTDQITTERGGREAGV
jgi:FeS assembly SUF system regulator